MIFVHLPTIIVGDHRHGGIGDLGFARAFGFAEIGHADDVVAELVIRQRFGAGTECRSFHIHIRATIVNGRARTFRTAQDDFPQLLTNGVGEGDVADNAAPKKGVLEIALGPVEELVRQHDIARFVFFLQGADGADADDPGDAEFFHGPEIRAMVQLAWQNPVSATVTRQENNFAPRKFAGEQGIGRIAEWRFDLYPFLIGEAFNVIETATADDADFVLRHGSFLPANPAKHTKKLRQTSFSTGI